MEDKFTCQMLSTSFVACDRRSSTVGGGCHFGAPAVDGQRLNECFGCFHLGNYLIRREKDENKNLLPTHDFFIINKKEKKGELCNNSLKNSIFFNNKNKKNQESFG